MAQPANNCPHHKGARMRKLRDKVRGNDVIARLGGEEYWRCAPGNGAKCKYTAAEVKGKWR